MLFHLSIVDNTYESVREETFLNLQYTATFTELIKMPCKYWFQINLPARITLEPAILWIVSSHPLLVPIQDPPQLVKRKHKAVYGNVRSAIISQESAHLCAYKFGFGLPYLYPSYKYPNPTFSVELTTFVSVVLLEFFIPMSNVCNIKQSTSSTA